MIKHGMKCCLTKTVQHTCGVLVWHGMVLNYHVTICTLAQVKVFFFFRNQKQTNEDLAFKAYGEGTTCAGMWCVGCVVL